MANDVPVAVVENGKAPVKPKKKAAAPVFVNDRPKRETKKTISYDESTPAPAKKVSKGNLILT